MPEKAKLNKRTVDAVKFPPKPQSFNILWDTEIPGFGLRITETGIKSYILQYRINRRQRRYTIGRHGDWTADQARAEALELRRLISKGTDPQQEKLRIRDIPTLAKLTEEYLEHVKHTKRTWKGDDAHLRLRILPKLGQCRIDTITARQIENLHVEIKHKRTPATANRYLALIRRMLNLAVSWGYIDTNPARNVKAFKENNQRAVWLDAAQIRSLLEACAAHPNPYVGALFPFLLLTGARLGEALAARWATVDLDRAMWHIPEAKSGKGRHVPLAPQAVELLRQVPKQEGTPYVFCGHVKGKPLVNVAKPWKVLSVAAQLPNGFRIHDLRHTFASWGVSNGIDLYHIQQLLGHASSQMTQRYSHLAEAGIKSSVAHISLSMHAALGPTERDTRTINDG